LLIAPSASKWAVPVQAAAPSAHPRSRFFPKNVLNRIDEAVQDHDDDRRAKTQDEGK
jgi:hypothetical protein